MKPSAYAISAKSTVRAAAGLSYASALCQLRVGSSVLDTSRVGNGAFASDTKLTAIRVGEVSSQEDVTG